MAARPPATLACSCLDAAPCSGPSASGICSGMQTHSRGGRYRVPNTQVTVIPVPMAEHGRAAKAAAEPRAPITVVAAATAAPAASGAAAAPAAAPAPAPAAALDGRGRAPFDTEPERAARRDERGRKPALYHRKVGHGPCGIFRCVGNHRPTNYMIVRARRRRTRTPCRQLLAGSVGLSARLPAARALRAQDRAGRAAILVYSFLLAAVRGRTLQMCGRTLRSCASGPSTATARSPTATRTSSRRCSATTSCPRGALAGRHGLSYTPWCLDRLYRTHRHPKVRCLRPMRGLAHGPVHTELSARLEVAVPRTAL